MILVEAKAPANYFGWSFLVLPDILAGAFYLVTKCD